MGGVAVMVCLWLMFQRLRAGETNDTQITLVKLKNTRA
jgi:hypothetical protein